MLDCYGEVRAYELLHEPAYAGSLNAEDLQELAIQAGLSVKTAQKMASKRAAQRMEKDLPP